MTKKLTAILTAAMLIICLFTATAYADPASGTYGDAQWTLENGVLTITGTGSVGKGRERYVPASWATDVDKVVIEEGITKIKWGAFYGCSMSEVEFPSTLEYIDNKAFAYCTNLTSVELPESLSYLGDDNFAGCTALESINIPSNVKIIYNNMFFDCTSLNDIEIEEGVERIKSSVFAGCSSLESIELPSTLKYLGGFAFGGCTSLKSIIIPNGVTGVDLFAFDSCTSLENISLPGTLTKISGGSFTNCTSLTEIEIPEGVTAIEENAFGGCAALRTIIIPSTLSYMGDNVFAGCDNLTEIRIGENNMYLSTDSQFAIYNKEKTELMAGPANAETVVIPDTVSVIDSLAFSYNPVIKDLYIPASVTSIGDFAFYDCTALETVYYAGTQEDWNNISIADCNDSLLNANIVFNEAPEEVHVIEISAQPVSAMAFTGETADFSVEAIGEGLSYQWQYNASGEWKNSTSKTAGYNTATLTVEGTAGRNGYQYRCVITDEYDNEVITDAVTLTVRDAIIINSQPVSASADENTNAVFSVTADGFGLSYQWQYKMTENGSWRDSTTATLGYNTDTLTVVATAGRNNYTYRCVITDMYGHTLTTSEAVLTTIISTPSVVITQQPANTTADENAIATFHIEAEGENLTYLWQYKTATGKNWNDCTDTTPGYNTDTITVEAIERRNGHNYRCVITGPDGYNVTSNIAVLTVVPAGSTTVEDEENSNDGFSLDAPAEIIIASQPTSVNALSGNTAYFSVEVTGGNVSYQWQYKVPGKDWRNSTEATIGYNSEVLAVEAAEKRDGYEYRCIITDVAGNVLTSDAAVLTVRPAVTIDVQPVSVTTEENTRAIFSVMASGDGLSYQWQYKTPNNAKWRNSTELTLGFDTSELNVEAAASRDGYSYRCIITDINGNCLITDAVTLSIILI